MPETIETLFAREQTEMLSQVTTQQILHIVFTSRRQTNDERFSHLPLHYHQVKYKEDGRKEMSVNLLSSALPEAVETLRVKEQQELQSHVCIYICSTCLTGL